MDGNECSIRTHFLSYKPNKETWTVEDIDRRNEILKRYVLELYKVPEVNSAE